MDPADLPQAVQRTWLNQLYGRWHTINRESLDGQLSPPVIQLSKAELTLGSWQATTRTLTMSAALMATATWREVEETLRHEMAHQFVSEAFGAPSAEHHGTLFQRACRLLDISGAATTKTALDPKRDAVMSRIRKLLNLAGSDNVHESQAAMAAANRLLLRHNIAIAETTDDADCGYLWVGRAAQRVSICNKLLACLLQDFYFVRAIWISSRRVSDDAHVRRLELVGRRQNLETAEYAHIHLTRTLDRCWAAYRERLPVGRRRQVRRSYRVGLLAGYREHLETQQRSCREEGLIWLGDPAVDDFYDRRFPRRTMTRGGRYQLGEAYRQGVSDGQQIRVRPGLRGAERNPSRGLALPD